MKKYRVIARWEGYSRGISEWEVEAESMDQAEKNFDCGTQIKRTVIRDDTEDVPFSLEEVRAAPKR